MNKKIAVFHNALDTIGGGEMVALFLCQELEADLYTTNINHDAITKMGFKETIPRIFSIGKIPNSAPFKQQFALWKFRNLNLGKKYDHYIIAGDWAMSGAIHNKPNIWYAHTPLNEIWSFKEFIKTNMLPKWKWPFYNFWCYVNQKITRKYANEVNVFMTASDVAQERMKEFYKKESLLVYPPINTEFFSGADPEIKLEKNYWLSVNRLAQNKRVEMQIEAFSEMKDQKLIIVYDYDSGSQELRDYHDELTSKATGLENIIFIKAPERMELIKLYKESKGFITTSIGESFGTTASESMAAGTPVIAPRDGGYKYAVIDNETGILIDDINKEKLIEAIKLMNAQIMTDKYHYFNRCLDRAKKYSYTEFMRKINENLV